MIQGFVSIVKEGRGTALLKGKNQRGRKVKYDTSEQNDDIDFIKVEDKNIREFVKSSKSFIKDFILDRLRGLK